MSERSLPRQDVGGYKLKECGELLYEKRFPLAVYKSCVRPEIQYESEARCLKGSETGISHMKE